MKGIRTLNEENLGEALKVIRVSLLEADVEFQVARDFIERVREKALGELVETRVKHKDKKLKVAPGDHFIKLCHDELIDLMGPADPTLNFPNKAVGVVMMIGLQGSGKTTTAAKLARYLVKNGKRPMLVAADVYRPAAVQQLRKLGSDLDVPVYSNGGFDPPQICSQGLAYAQEQHCDVAIFDTAGRLTVDEPLMDELYRIQETTRPDNVLLVCDAMIGQESVNIAKAFNERIRLTGFILTKMDGDARGGAALSIKEATGVPIKFIGMGEALDRLEEFRPDGLASRILGFGDIVGLVKEFEDVVDERKAEEDALRMLQGQFDLSDFLTQIKSIKQMGPLQDLVDKLPFFPQGMPDTAQVDDYELVRIESLINSMTKEERKNPAIIDKSRMGRIARGSGRTEADVNGLLKKFRDMQGLMAAMGGGGKLKGPWKKLKGLRKMFSGGMPPGMDMDMPGVGPDNPFGMPEIKAGGTLPKKSLKKKKQKRKQARQARKKAKKK